MVSGVQNESDRIPPTIYGSPLPPIPTSKFVLSCMTFIFEKNCTYTSKEKLKNKLSLHAIKNNYEFRVKKTNTKRFDATCGDNNCTSKPHVTPMFGAAFESVMMYVPYHTCSLTLCIMIIDELVV